MSFLGWRRSSFKGETINLVGPLAQRLTVGTSAVGKPTVYFFGGSTMWGTGADDANTIPSLVTQLGGYAAENFAEPGWIAHQSLLLLIKLLQEDHRPDVVVFYDGVNDVLQRCRTEVRPDAHSREAVLRSALKASKAENVYGLQYMLGPLTALANVVASRLTLWFRNEERHYNRHFACHADSGRAQRVAENLVQDWEIARRLVEGYGGRFIGILQPVSYLSDTKLEHLRLPRLEGKQYEIVYALVKEKMAQRSSLYDFTSVLNQPEHIYIDFCHLSPNGNRYVAQKLVETLDSLN